MRILVAWLILTGGALAAELDFDLERLTEDSRQQHTASLVAGKSKLTVLKQGLVRVKNGRIDPSLAVPQVADSNSGNFTFQSKDDRSLAVRNLTSHIDVLNAELAEARRGERGLIPVLRSPFIEGQVGRFPEEVKVFQVASEDGFLGNTIFDPENQPFRNKVLVWIHGVGTGNLSDDSVVEFSDWDDVFVCAGNKKYGTAIGGTNAVPSFRALNPEEIAAVRQSLNRARSK